MDDWITESVSGEFEGVFQEALNFLEKKVTVDYKTFKEIREKYQNLAFSVKGYTEMEVLNEFLEALKDAVREGSTKEAFRERMNTFLEDNGYTGLTPYHSDLIFRQNMQTAYNAGHYEQMTDPGVMERRKYWQYQTAGDGKVREEHAVMDGRVYPADSGIWDIWFPPNGFGCRCTVVSLTPEQVKRKGLEVSDLLPDMVDLQTGEIAAALPDPGFRTNPAKSEWKPDAAGFPEGLKRAFEEKQNRRRNGV